MIDQYPAWKRPCIDHSLLSPSGRMSKWARKAALKREEEKLFAGVTLEREPESIEAKQTRMLNYAKELRALAARGMKPRAFRKLAERLENEAANLVEEVSR